MWRVVGILAALVVWAAPARADTTLSTPTGVSITAGGEWELDEVGELNGAASRRYVFKGTYLPILVTFSDLIEVECEADSPDQVAEYIQPESVAGFDTVRMIEGQDAWMLALCVTAGDWAALVSVQLPSKLYFGGPDSEPARDAVAAYAAQVRPLVEAKFRTSIPRISLELRNSEITIEAPAQWSVDESDPDGDTLVDGKAAAFAFVYRRDGVSCADAFAEIDPDAGPSAAALPSGWTAVESDANGKLLAYSCHELEGDAIVVATVPDTAELAVAFIDSGVSAAAVTPEQPELYLPRSGLTIRGDADWRVVDKHGYDGLENGKGDVAAFQSYDLTCDQVFAELPGSATSSLMPDGWAGVDYEYNGFSFSTFCWPNGDGSSFTVTGDRGFVGWVIFRLDLVATPVTASDSSTVVTLPFEPERRPPRSLIDHLLPQTVSGAVVRRADDMTSGWGGGIAISRMTWQEHHRKWIGYELSGAFAKDWWQLGAQLRPGISPSANEVAASIYAAFGVDGTGGSAGPEVPFAPVGGIGADALLEIPVGMLDVAAQVLFDPSGLHSYTLHGGLGFGDDTGMVRVGVRYTGLGDAGSTTMITIGFTRMRNGD